jgi:GNAT superfamily N-acetyltransferase
MSYAVAQIDGKKLEDFIPMVEAISAFFRKGRVPGGFNYKAFLTTWDMLINMRAGVVFGIYDPKPLGCLGALIHPDPMDGSLVITEAFWFVAPESRGVGRYLLDELEEWGKEIGAKRLVMSHLVTIDDGARLGRFFVKRGFTPMELHYVKEL